MSELKANSYFLSPQSGKDNDFFRFLKFKKECGIKNGNITLVSQILGLVINLHTLLGYIMLQNKYFQALFSDLQTIYQSQSTALYVISIINYIVIISTVASLLLVNKNEKLPYLATHCLKMLIGNIQIVSKVSLILSAFMAFFNFEANIAALVLASFLCLTENILLGNYQTKTTKDYRFCSLLSILLELWYVLTLIINTIIVRYLNASLQTIWSIFSGILLLCWYSKGGFRLFYDKNFSLVNRLLVAVTISLSTEFAILFIKSNPQQRGFSFIEWGFAFATVFVCLHFYLTPQTLNIGTLRQNISLGSVKQLQFCLFEALEEGDSNIEYLSFLKGIVNEHEFHQCKNKDCWLKERDNLDAVYQLSKENPSKQISFICKFYIRCAYETALLQNTTPKIMIDYCQFMISEFQNVYSCYYYLQRSLAVKKLTLLQQIRFTKLKLVLEQRFNLNEEFDKNTNLLQILNSQKQFNEILSGIKQYCQYQVQLQNLMMLKQIDANQIRDKITKGSLFLEELDKKWTKMSKFIRKQKKMHFLFLLYMFFLKNQSINNQILRSLSQNFLQKNIEGAKDKGKKLDLFKLGLSFDPFSFVVVTVFKEKELVFFQISKAFSSLTLYRSQQIINTPLKIILPQEIQSKHNQIVLQNFKQGKINFKAKKLLYQTYFIKKNLVKQPCIVFFKLFIDFIAKDDNFKFAAYVKQESSFVEQQLFDKEPFQQKDHLFFAQNNSINLFLLKNSHNIFFKEQSIQPVNQMIKIKQFKLVIRLFVLVLIAVAIGFFIQTSKKADAQIKLVNTWSQILFCYRFPIALAKSYLKLSFQIGNVTQTQNSIGFATSRLATYLNDKQTIEFLSDETINTEGRYAPFETNQINKGLAYDQIDVFYLVMECIMTLSKKKTVNRTGYEFMQLNSYIMPGYDSMINNTKLQFHYKLAKQISSSRFELELTIILITSTLLLIIIALRWNLAIFNQQNREAFQALFNFRKNYHPTIVKYWKQIQRTFSIFSRTQKGHGQLLQNTALCKFETKVKIAREKTNYQKIKPEQAQTIYSNNQPIKIDAQRQGCQHDKVKLAFTFAFFFVVSPVLAIITYNLVQFAQLSKFQAEGFQLFRFYPANTVIGFAMITKYYSYAYPLQHTFQISRFSDTIRDLKIIAETEYLAGINGDSLFYDKVKNYFFGNPCTYNPAVLDTANSTLSKCVGYLNHTLTTGLIPFFRYVTPQVEGYLQGRVNYTASQMDNIANGFALAEFYFSDLIISWTEQYNRQLTSLKNINVLLIIVAISSVLVIHFVSFESWFMRFLIKEHTLVRDIYDRLVPNEVLSRQKLVNRKFQEAGIVAG